jgi:hypothetical protein
VPPTDAELIEAVQHAERIVTQAIPLGLRDPGDRPELLRFRELAYTEVLRELLAAARQPCIVTSAN